MSIGAWEPLWLGTPGRRLYAALHPAAGSVGVLLVPPLLHELPRSRRFMAEVANEFAAMGLPCLRFDFHGSGDSSGEGEALDFASMHRDLDVAADALRSRSGATRIALVAWRGSALALRGWIQHGADVQLVVLWEPIIDGQAWLQELIDGDASERAERPPAKPGVPRLTDPSDGQLMGFPASAQFRRDLSQARLDHAFAPQQAPVWAVMRGDARSLPVQLAKVIALPDSAPRFDMGAAMDATFFLTPQVRDVVGSLAQALRREAA